ncbi:Zinc finger SWIM domain-containing protein 8 [Lepeophtheirus salmonis]|uniref:Zinc finger SWIM domain-containing protein 8 n=1 Tax=Lepeophtheirus salmonis TaxID=72036 RepID=A0A7R8CLQ4_LEPSM|nr:Zinc finger SWIM domain-containing protein 8 [Lepeophtheirus salmonis]CAF2815098.1 Zinc finger SWIM domain-containing protein 8 [Lepeophtheirus salmonis]
MMDDVGGLVADLDENFDEEVEDEDEDSVCSWMSDSESVVHNWRGWKVMGLRECVSGCEGGGGVEGGEWSGCLKGPLSLCELGARSVARWIPFELVERYYPPVPEEVQLRIAFWSFPEREEDIRLYSCLANGSGSTCLPQWFPATGRRVSPLPSRSTGSGLCLVSVPASPKRSGALTLWHPSLYRIHRSVTLRAPVSESLSRLRRDQLQKFAQYLIAELPLQILPAAQKILDELLSQSPTAINTVCGAPDPTAGGSASELSSFYLDSKNLKNNISTILIKFCVPSPIVFSDVNYLSTTPPLSAAEWTSYLRPLRGREPEGIWNLLSIVREMFRRCDHNALPLLEILTLQCIETAQIMVWWFYTKVALQQKGPAKHNVNSNSQASQNACAYLCDEIVTLWKLATLNPCISPQERQTLKQRLIYYHTSVIHKIKANQNSVPNKSNNHCSQVNSSQAVIRCEYPTTARSHRTIARESNESDEGVEMNGNNVESVHQRIEPQDENDRDSDWSSSAQDSGEVRRSNSHVVFDVDNQEQEDLQYRVYFYDSGVPINTRSNEKDKELVDVFKICVQHACSLAVHLANDMLKSTLDLLAESRSVNGGNIVGGLNKRHKRNVNAATHQVTLTASNTLSHCAFLCSVLLENESYHSLAFQIAMYGLEMPRPPASIKPMEVKLANQESELVNLLKRVPQGQWELNIIREKALQLKEASFIFESLVRASGIRSCSRSHWDESECNEKNRKSVFQSLNLRNESSYERDYHRSQSDWGQFLDDHKEESLSNRHNRNKGTRNRGNDQASDSGSSGNSSADSIDSSSSSSAVLRVHQAHNSSDTSLTWIRKTSSSQSLMHGGLVHFGSGAISNRGPTLSSVTTNSNIAPRPIVSGLKINRFRGKRNCPSLPNQPSDSLAHFMYELAKTVLTKAGGNSSTSLFNQQTASSNHRGPHRALLMCAFQIGLYSLGLYNAVTSNWLSRTYSSQVHWVTSQALEIGTPAIEFLIGTWEGHLSPTEAVSIADRVSRGRDPHVIRASAELALSVLPHASALKVTEIQRAICQCQQQSQDMLERACLAVEKAATGGGVYPEHHEQQSLQISQHSVPNIAPQDSQAIHQQLQVATGVHYPFYGLISRFPQAPSLSGHHLQQQFQAAAAVQRQAAVQAVAAAAAAVANPPPFQMYPSGGNSPVSVTTAHTRFGGIYQLSAAIPSGQIGSLLSASPSVSSVGQKQPTQTVQSGVPFPSNANSVGHVSHRFLISAYRVGMLALESLGRRTTEERPEVRFAQNPTYGPDVMWLKSISRMLGLNYFQNFLVIIGATIASPFLLQELTLEGAINLACAANSGAQSGIPSSSSVSLTFSNTSSSTGNTVGYSTIMQSIRSNPHLTQLASKCYQMYYQCIHQRLFQLAPEDYEEFASIILHARKAFYWTVEGPRTFQTLLQSIRRSKSCTKELWQKVLSRVQNTTIEQL